MLRENGFSPLGIPRLRGSVYTIAVIDRRGDDGRLMIDARDGRIVRFRPGISVRELLTTMRAGALWAAGRVAAARPSARAPRPPAPVPHVASRGVPVPKPSPLAPKPARRAVA